MKSWDKAMTEHIVSKPKKEKKKKKKERDTRDGYYTFIKKLEDVLPDEELRTLGRNYGTKRKETVWANICRVVPADWVNCSVLLEMPKENNIYPQDMIKVIYHELLAKLNKKRGT